MNLWKRRVIGKAKYHSSLFSWGETDNPDSYNIANVKITQIWISVESLPWDLDSSPSHVHMWTSRYALSMYHEPDTLLGMEMYIIHLILNSYSSGAGFTFQKQPQQNLAFLQFFSPCNLALLPSRFLCRIYKGLWLKWKRGDKTSGASFHLGVLEHSLLGLSHHFVRNYKKPMTKSMGRRAKNPKPEAPAEFPANRWHQPT